MQVQSVVIVGGGVGGAVTARELRRRLRSSIRVVLIDRQERAVFQPSLLWMMTGRRTRAQISRRLDRLAGRGTEVIRAEVTSIDPARKSVLAGGKEISGDFLVIAPGAELAPDQVPGLTAAGHNLYTVEGVERFRDGRTAVREGRIAVLVARTPFKCPAAPYEAAMLIQDDARKRGLAGKVTVQLYSPEPGPMPVTGPENSAMVRGMLEATGVGYFPKHVVSGVDSSSKTISFQDGTTARYDLLAYIPPHVAPRFVKEAGLTGESGWVAVDRNTMETRFPGVYAIGDVTAIPLKMGLPLPKAGTFAQGQAKAVAAGIAAKVTGRDQAGRFEGHGECFIETGRGLAGMGSGNFYAEPVPAVKLRRPARRWHWGKLLFERWWLWRWM
jgi:sulfide:quinone oxidoreductase